METKLSQGRDKRKARKFQSQVFADPVTRIAITAMPQIGRQSRPPYATKPGTLTAAAARGRARHVQDPAQRTACRQHPEQADSNANHRVNPGW